MATSTVISARSVPARLLRGASLSYIGLMIVIPVVALAYQALAPGIGPFWNALRDPVAWHAIRLTFVTAAAMVVVNAITGTATAWVLARYEFPGKTVFNALVDLPFAVPTIVTGVMLVVLYGPASTVGALLNPLGWAVIYEKPGIILALLFVSFPFVVRCVQPVLLELDRCEEEAARTLGATPWTTFRRVTLPALRPAILTGCALSFSRALGEFGSVVLVAGNRPMSTTTAPLYIFGEIEGGNRHGALVVSTVLLASSLAVLLVLTLLQRRGGGTHGH